MAKDFSVNVKQDFYRNQLLAGIETLGFSKRECAGKFTLNNQEIDKLLAYHQLLIKWNKVYNLTAVRDAGKMLSRHLLDSLSIAEFLQGNSFIDVGTGAGLPGLVLAIVFPDKHFTLLDSNGKKTRFLFQVKVELQLENVEVVHSRVEDYQPDTKFFGVISRAFSTLVEIISGSDHLLADNGYFYAMKGVYPKDELDQMKQLSVFGKHYKVSACHPLSIPDELGQRHLVVLDRVPDVASI